MSRHSMHIRDLDPQQVARDVTERILSYHSHRVAWDLGLNAEVITYSHSTNVRVGIAARLVTHYARTGEAPENVTYYVYNLCTALYSRAGDPDPPFTMPSDLFQGEPTTPHDLVMVAADTRLLIEQQQPVSLWHLAALSSAGDTPVSYPYARQLASRGKIRTNGKRGRAVRTVSADEARRWLAEHGVPGIQAPEPQTEATEKG